ncbi:glutamine rich 2 [Clonorchis sinensis]|uniref:Glutamine rich 2 n=1 Tax=Clonorchis sinensis TaxID=79923 RepID=G7YS66_CLOSI|nr:glutamine rich 2 [Clonorchis sinensis]
MVLNTDVTCTLANQSFTKCHSLFAVSYPRLVESYQRFDRALRPGFGPRTADMRSKRVTTTPQDRLSKVESQLAILNSLPDNRQLLGDLYSGSEGKSVKQDTADNQRRVAELWQTVNINRRVDATEEGVSRLRNEDKIPRSRVNNATNGRFSWVPVESSVKTKIVCE